MKSTLLFQIDFALRQYLQLSMVLFLLFTFSMETIAQEKCLSHIIRDQQNAANPELKRKREVLERQIQNYMNANPNAREGAQVNIPVVFRVIHNGDAIGTGENLSDAQLMAQLNQLNADFARMNTDANMTPAAFQGVAANTMIQFCLATMDPNGQPTTGIVRTNLNLDQNACWNADFITTNILGAAPAWNTANFLNIYTVLKIAQDDCSNDNILGYATFPGGPAATDVAVHAYYTIGSLASPNPVNPTFGMGRTVTHEVGHWLMLEHIWFDPGCGTDDGVADTPPQDSDSNGCPTFPTTDACTPGGNGIMFMNYMDYVDDNCMNMFTQGQATRMMAAITNSRPGLLNSQCGMNPGGTGYTCATAIEINAAGTYNAPGPNQGNGAIPTSGFTHANWYRFTPPMTGMINIFTCGLAGAGNQHNHVYTVNTGSCATLDLNQVAYTEDRGCTNDPADGVRLENVPVTMGVPIYIEWDDALSNTPFTWTLEYQGGGGGGCMDYAANDVPINIPDNTPAGINSVINVTTGGVVSDINIKNLNGNHTYIGALVFKLQSPQGTMVTLINNACNTNGGTDFNISLDDQATNALSCPYNTGNTEQPENALAIFNGQNPMGNWTLTVADNDEFGDVGALNGWTLEVCTQGGGNCPPTLAVNNSPIAGGTFQAGTQLTSSGSVGAGNTVIFRAGNNVQLLPNFTVPLTSIFEARIAGCP